MYTKDKTEKMQIYNTDENSNSSINTKVYESIGLCNLMLQKLAAAPCHWLRAPVLSAIQQNLNLVRNLHTNARLRG